MRRVLITVTRQCVKLICGGGESENWEGKIIFFFFPHAEENLFIYFSLFNLAFFFTLGTTLITKMLCL